MRKAFLFLLCLLPVISFSSVAMAQEIACPDAGLVLSVPDAWREVPLTGADDPELRLRLDGGAVSLYLYVSDSGDLLPDAFQVFLGDETESSVVTLSGRRMALVAGSGAEGDYRIYTWQDRRRQVQLYFLIVSRPDASRKTIDGIMDSIAFR